MMARMNVVEKLRSRGEKAVSWSKELPSRYRRWTRYASLSPSERLLNIGLWVLAVVALTYAVLHHVWLVTIPSPVWWGPPVGVVCYELSIAYTGAFVFYLLVVRVPLRRDRRNTYRRLTFTIHGPVNRAVELMRYLYITARMNDESGNYDPRNSWDHLTRLCTTLTPNTPAKYWGPTLGVWMTTMELIRLEISMIREANAAILSSPNVIPTEVTDLVGEIDRCHFLGAPQSVFPWIEAGRVDADADMSSWMVEELFQYLCLVDRYNEYIKEWMPYLPPPWPEFDRTEIPLRDIMDTDAAPASGQQPVQPTE
jgi:hypothetical protein